MIKATINGVEGNFIFDTGAGISMITKKFAATVDNLEKTVRFHTGHRQREKNFRQVYGKRYE